MLLRTFCNIHLDIYISMYFVQAVSRFTYGEEQGCGGLVNVTASRGQVTSLDLDR